MARQILQINKKKYLKKNKINIFFLVLMRLIMILNKVMISKKNIDLIRNKKLIKDNKIIKILNKILKKILAKNHLRRFRHQFLTFHLIYF